MEFVEVVESEEEAVWVAVVAVLVELGGVYPAARCASDWFLQHGNAMRLTNLFNKIILLTTSSPRRLAVPAPSPEPESVERQMRWPVVVCQYTIRQ